MVGHGRALDKLFFKLLWRNAKHKEVYLKGYVNVPELLLGLAECFELYNTERPHQSLGCCTPVQVYQTASGGGARIVDKIIERKTTLKTWVARANC
jgi:putative transposase